MTQWASAPQDREQMVLFSARLDDAIPADHRVRILDDILSQIDWTPWEARYSVNRGQPAIHPRVLSGVLLYGLLTRIRSSRALEEALTVRLDFLWLVEGRSIDHTTLSEFRRTRWRELKDLFVQIGLLARQMGLLPLEQLAFDGTRIRANNRTSGSRTPDRLREMKAELEAKYIALETQMSAADARDEEVFGTDSAHALPGELADVKRRRNMVDRALAELKKMEDAQETVPKRLPITDPQSRISPNKDGGFAPNYTPLATVDVSSGLIVSADVIAGTDESGHLVEAIEDVQQQFGLETPPPEVLADGMMSTGKNLSELKDRGVTLYSPISKDDADNPAIRDDLSQPVPQEKWDQLPAKNRNRGGKKYRQLDKSAFIFDTERNCYWCPQGKPLPHVHTTSETFQGRPRIRRRHIANEEDCASCPLRELCLSGKAKRRQISREQHEELRVEHAERMDTPEAQEKYEKRRHCGERPFAVIKHQFGARRFLLRGLEQVKTEWRWLATAFNLQSLINTIWGRAGPSDQTNNVLTIH